MSELAFSQPDQETAIRHRAMDLLARREHSREELRRKLLQRFPDESSLLDTVLDTLANDNLQSDQRFAEAFIDARISKGQGPHRIRAELRQRGVSELAIDQALNNCEVDWFERARQVAEKKYPGKRCDSFAERGKRSRFLQYRGFSPDHIDSALA